MSRDTNPFLDSTLIRGALYQDADRLRQRSGALNRAKITGSHVPDFIGELAARWLPENGFRSIADIGCGRGSSTLALASRFAADRITGIDLSPALLTSAAQRLHASGYAVPLLCADFHHLPLREASCDLIVAAFCLYHTPQPALVIAEISRCLTRDGIAVLVTKSEDSYRQLDILVARAGLDPDAATRPSLYTTANSANLPTITAGHLQVKDVVHQLHTFRFAGLDRVAEYLATNPKYVLPPMLDGNSAALATALRTLVPEEPLLMTSTITYVVGSPLSGTR